MSFGRGGSPLRLLDPSAPADAGAILPHKQQTRRSDGTEPRRGPPKGGPQTGEGSAQDGGVLGGGAVLASGISTPLVCHTFRHPLAAHQPERGQDLRTNKDCWGAKTSKPP